MEINILKTQQELISSIARHFIKIVQAAIDDRGVVNVALAGTQDIYKIYAESFLGKVHLEQIMEESQSIVKAAVKNSIA